MRVLLRLDYGMNDRSRVAAKHVWFERGGAPAVAGRAGWGVKPMVGPAREPDDEPSSRLSKKGV